jgi:crotonobetainyl-CoA:carnitine CoA-transferase CaiB-like acyl-CoA transferase
MTGPLEGIKVIELGVWVAGPAAGGIVSVPDGDSSVPMVATPADFHGTPWAPRSVAPRLGEHTDEILAELGKS